MKNIKNYITINKEDIKKTCNFIKQEFVLFFRAKDFNKFFTFVFFSYLVGYLSLLLANIDYIDDKMRNIKGFTKWDNFSRYLSSFLAHIFHMSERLTDTSPINQIFALVFLSIASLILVHIFLHKFSFLHLFATLALGMSPFFLQNMSFKYDAHYMSLAVLASIVPYLFIKDKLAFWIIGALSLLVMLTTYQAANQVYLEVGIFYILLKFLENKSRQDIKKEIIHILLLLISTTLIFKSMFVSDIAEHRHTGVSTFMPHELPLGVLDNLSKYFSLIYDGLKGTYLLKISLFILLLFPIIIHLKYNNIKKTFLSIFFLVLGLLSSYGLYTVLYNPLMNYRELNGIGTFFAIILLFISNNKIIDYKKTKLSYLNNIIIILFSYNLIIIANTYGNAIYRQENYNQLRTLIMLSDLTKFTNQLRNKKYYFSNSIRNEITLEQNSSKQFPLLDYLILERLQMASAQLHFLSLLPTSISSKAIEKNQILSIDCSTNQKLLKSLDNDFHKLELYENNCLKIFYK